MFGCIFLWLVHVPIIQQPFVWTDVFPLSMTILWSCFFSSVFCYWWHIFNDVFFVRYPVVGVFGGILWRIVLIFVVYFENCADFLGCFEDCNNFSCHVFRPPSFLCPTNSLPYSDYLQPTPTDSSAYSSTIWHHWSWVPLPCCIRWTFCPLLVDVFSHIWCMLHV